jgi:hypothetical protein
MHFANAARMRSLEHDRPGDWLRRLAEDSDGYRVLIAESGGRAHAAYRVARARCRLSETGLEPTLGDMQAALEVLACATGNFERLPITSLLPASSRPSEMRWRAAPPAPSTRRSERLQRAS